MSDTSLSISFVSSTSGVLDHNARRYVHLEQVEDTGDSDRLVTMSDISQMIARAKSGVSAFTQKAGTCSFTYVNNIFSTWFHFYVWPSSRTLGYELSASMGNIDRGVVIRDKVTFRVLFELSDYVHLDFLLDDITYTFEMTCRDENGAAIMTNDIDLQMDNYTTIRSNKSFFGVVKVSGYKIGMKHKLTTILTPRLPDADATLLPTDIVSWQNGFAETILPPVDGLNMTGYSITNLNINVMAKWVGVTGEDEVETLKLEVPQCVKDALEMCGDPTNLDGLGAIVNIFSSSEISDDEPELTGGKNALVYFSICDGGVLDIVETDAVK